MKKDKIDVCFHHTDHDGLCGGSIVGADKNVRIGYNTKLSNTDLINLCAGQTVVMVDFSLELTKMQLIKEIAKEFIWIDHHESARVCTSLNLPGIFSVEKAGCALAWEFFNPDKPLPDVVKYVADRDIWKFELPDSRNYGFGLTVTNGLEDPASEIWKSLLESNRFTKDIINAGEIVARVIDTDILWTTRNNLFRKNKMVFVINASANVSELASSILDLHGQDSLVIVWQISKKGLRMSFRGKYAKESAEEIGKAFNVRAGGHERAAGSLIPLDDPRMWDFISNIYESLEPCA